MRTVLGVLSLLIVMVVLGLLAKNQLSHLSPAPLRQQDPAVVDTSPDATPVVQIQQQIKLTVEAAMQQERAVPDDAK